MRWKSQLWHFMYAWDSCDFYFHEISKHIVGRCKSYSSQDIVNCIQFISCSLFTDFVIMYHLWMLFLLLLYVIHANSLIFHSHFQCVYNLLSMLHSISIVSSCVCMLFHLNKMIDSFEMSKMKLAKHKLLKFVAIPVLFGKSWTVHLKVKTLPCAVVKRR